jgi:acetyl esterase/lipase
MAPWRDMREDLQDSLSYAGGTQLADLKKVNCVVLGGESAGGHLFMQPLRAARQAWPVFQGESQLV